MSGNVKFTPYNDANKVGNELFESLRSKYQDNLEKSVKGNEFFFDSIQLMLMYYKYHKVSFKHGGSYIDSADFLKIRKAKINPKDEDEKCF